MRKVIPVVSLAFLVGAMACGRKESAESATGRPPERDLTLQTPAPAVVAIASPVELARPAVQRPRAARKVPRPNRTGPISHPTAAPEVVPVPEPVPVAESVAEPAVEPPADVPAGAGRELAPGQTVTILPASAGPSSSDGDELDLPVESARRGIFIGGGGGTCRPRGGARGGVRGFRITFR